MREGLGSPQLPSPVLQATVACGHPPTSLGPCWLVMSALPFFLAQPLEPWQGCRYEICAWILWKLLEVGKKSSPAGSEMASLPSCPPEEVNRPELQGAAWDTLLKL